MAFPKSTLEYHFSMFSDVVKNKLKMAAGFIKLDKPIEVVQAEVQKRFAMAQYNELLSDEVEQQRRYKLNCIFLYATAGVKKFN